MAKAKKELDIEELRLELAMTAYNSIFSNPEMYKIARENYIKSTSSISVSNTIAIMCFNAADEFIKKLKQYK